MEPVISFDQFSFYYKGADLPVLSQLSFKINKGEVVLVLGSSGSGKSTLFRCINGLIPNYYEGNYTGKFAINHSPAFFSSIFDKSNLIASFTQELKHVFLGQSVAEELSFILPKTKMSHGELVSLIEFSLDRWGLKSVIMNRPQTLSTSQQATLQLLKVFLSEKAVLLFDQPLLNQDNQIRQRFFRDLRATKAAQKTVVLFDNHIDDDLLQYVDRVIILDEGTVIYNGEPNALLHSNILEQLNLQTMVHLQILNELGLDFQEYQDLIHLGKMDVKSINFRHYDYPQEKKSSKQLLLELKDYRADQPTKKLVLNNLAFKVYEGEILIVTGVNGSGKTSLAQAIMGMIPNRGQLLHRGQQLRRLNAKNRLQHFAYAWPDPYRMYGKQKVSRVITSFLESKGVAANQLANELDLILKEYILQNRRFSTVESLSMAEKYRLILATTDFDKPSLLMVEEELMHQPSPIRQKLMAILSQKVKEGKSLVYFSKNPRFLLEEAHRLILMDEGKVVEDSNLIDLLDKPTFVSKYHLVPTSFLPLATKLLAKPQDLLEFYRLKYGGLLHE